MANWQRNRFIKGKQFRTLVIAGSCFLLVIALIIVLLVDGRPKKRIPTKETVDLTGIVDESFTEANADSALTAQQAELESLKNQITKLAQSIKTMNTEYKHQLQAQASEFKTQLTTLKEKESQNNNATENPPELKDVQNPQLWHDNTYAMNTPPQGSVTMPAVQPQIHTVSFRPKLRARLANPLNPAHYVPSNTSVRAVILGGADADASVNGQSKNNGVMLFKFLEDGTLPNGQHSRLRGCRVSGNSYGDISSERAFATLYRLSCAHPGEPIIDKEVTGWVFFNGKVGIKGEPLMRDGKVMQWAGLGGMISSAASVAQSAQSFQQLSPLGATSFVPSANLIPYTALGGTAKTGETLSQYYIQRAEQYHPVIQVGAGNVVTIVFKDGFYLEPDDDKHQKQAPNQSATANQSLIDGESQNSEQSLNFSVPPEVLGRIDQTQTQERNYKGALP